MRRRELRLEAVSLADQYDTVIYIGGLDHSHDCEGNDREDMKLPYEQDVLISELLNVRPDMIVVMVAGSPVEMGAWIDRADTVVWGWYAGMEGGSAWQRCCWVRLFPQVNCRRLFIKPIQTAQHTYWENFQGVKRLHTVKGCMSDTGTMIHLG